MEIIFIIYELFIFDQTIQFDYYKLELNLYIVLHISSKMMITKFFNCHQEIK